MSTPSASALASWRITSQALQVNPVAGPAADPGEPEPAVQRSGGRVVDVDVERDTRLAAGPHPPDGFADQVGADVAAARRRDHPQLGDPAGRLADDESDIGRAEAGEQRPVRAEVLVIADPLPPPGLRPSRECRTVTERRVIDRGEP